MTLSVPTWLKSSLNWLERLTIVGSAAFGINMIQVDEYLAAAVLWALTAALAMHRLVAWDGISDRAQLTGALKTIGVLGLIVLWCASIWWTDHKRSGKPWSAFFPLLPRIASRDAPMRPQATEVNKPMVPPPARSAPSVPPRSHATPKGEAPPQIKAPAVEKDKPEEGRAKTGSTKPPDVLGAPSFPAITPVPPTIFPGQASDWSSPLKGGNERFQAELQAKAEYNQAMAKDLESIIATGNDLYKKCAGSDCQGEIWLAMKRWYDSASSCLHSGLGAFGVPRNFLPIPYPSLADGSFSPESAKDATLRYLGNNLETLRGLANDARMGFGTSQPYYSLRPGKYSPCQL